MKRRQFLAKTALASAAAPMSAAPMLQAPAPMGDKPAIKPGFPFWPWHGHRIHPRCAEYHVFSR